MLTEIYFDNSATTRVCPEAARKAMEMMTQNYGNPSSMHALGFRAEQELRAAREAVSSFLGAQPEEIYFTSGGTESNNIAIEGAAEARKKRGKRIVTTAIEHHSVLKTAKHLEQKGFEIVYLKPDKRGKIDPKQVRSAITPDTILVSMMRVNNEVGSILPVEAAADAIEEKKAPALLHIDAVQAFGKLPLHAHRLRADLISVSGHKIHAPKGIGALYVRRGVHIVPLTYGGGQEKDMRPGTESMPLIAALGTAVNALPDLNKEMAAIKELNMFLRKGLSEIEGVAINSPDDALPYILNFSAGGVRAETMLHFLSEHGIYVSSGSACSKGHESHVLKAMGLPRERVASALRLSFCRYNTIDEAKIFLSVFREGMKAIVRRPL